MRKWVLIAVSLVVLVGFVPFICSHGPLKNLFLSVAGGKFRARVTAENVDMSWLGPQKFTGVQLFSPDLDGSVSKLVGHVPFWRLGSIGTEMELEGGAFQIHPANAESMMVDQVFAKISGAKIEASGVTHEKDQAGEFSIQGEAVNPSLQNTDIDLRITATRMPSLLIDRFAGLKGLFAGSVGPTFDCTAKATIQGKAGTFELNMHGDSTQAAIFASFDPDSIKLTKPLSISFQLTPALSETLLKNVNPLFLTGIQSKTSVIVQISEKNFLIPRPFSLEKLFLGQGMLDMGQIRIQNGPTLSSLVKLLKSENLSNLKQMNAWFTPVQFSIREGTLYTGRMDFLLADSVHLCTWGDMELLENEIDMTLGLPAETLTNAFGLKNIPMNYVMKIPIRGKISEPDIETGPATAKIAAMLAAQNLPRKKGMLGGILNLFNPAALDDSSDVPPPKRPFPWE